MSNKQKSKPVFHEAADALKPEFQPHHVGAEDEISFEEPLLFPKTPGQDPTADTLKNGWRTIGLEQQTGATFLVTHNLEAEGIPAFWRKTRALSHHRWVLNGKWSDSLTRDDILPEPRYWRELPK